MAERKPFLLRIDAGVLDALQRWAADDLRSVNGQIEFLLREALRQAPDGFSAATKCFCTEHEQRVADFAARVLGPRAVADDELARRRLEVQNHFPRGK